MGHKKKATKRGALTDWRPGMKGLIRTWKESDILRGTGTHRLKTMEGETSQNMER